VNFVHYYMKQIICLPPFLMAYHGKLAIIKSE